MRSFSWVSVLASVALLAACDTSSGSRTVRGTSTNDRSAGAARLRSTVSDRGSVLGVSRSWPEQITTGRPFEYTLTLTNGTSNERFDSVEIAEQLPHNVEVVSTTPRARRDESGRYVWRFAELPPGLSQTVRITARADNPGSINPCATVKFSKQDCQVVTVVQPALQLVHTGPPLLMACDPIRLTYRVTNTGTGMARGVQVTESLPAGLRTSDGRGTIRFDAGDLGPGESRGFDAELLASRSGRYELTATAASAGGLESKATVPIRIVRPELEVEIDSPGRSYLGRAFTYTMRVSNRGDGPAQQTKLEALLPTNATYVTGGTGALVDGRRVTWNLGTLDAGARRDVRLTVNPGDTGPVTGTAVATARCAATATASSQTGVAGISAILLEVIDLQDPVQVGQNQTFEVLVKNQGTAPGRNVRIVATLEDTMEFVEAGGATGGAALGRTVTFDPLTELAPGESVSWRVVVKAIETGDVRFGVRMTEDRLRRPVEETEASNYYQ